MSSAGGHQRHALIAQKIQMTALPQLVALAESAPPPVALAAIAALAAQGDGAATPALIAIADGGTPDRQRAALWALGELGDARAIAALVTALQSKDDRVAASAAWALGDLARAADVRPKLAPAASPALRRLARRGSWATAIDATAALARIGAADAAADLGQLVFHPSPMVRANAAWSLGALAAAGAAIPEDAVDALARQVTEDTSATARTAAARALGRLSSRTPAATIALEDAAEGDREERVRTEAKAALAGKTVAVAGVARAEWRVFYVVDASSADRAVKEEPYLVIGADGLAWATYTDLRGHVTAEHDPAGDAIVVTAGSEPGL
jgi:HEAT repeat protein